MIYLFMCVCVCVCVGIQSSNLMTFFHDNLRQASYQRAQCATVSAMHLYFHFGRATDLSTLGFRKSAYSSAETVQLNKLRMLYFKPTFTELTVVGSYSYFQTI